MVYNHIRREIRSLGRPTFGQVDKFYFFCFFLLFYNCRHRRRHCCNFKLFLLYFLLMRAPYMSVFFLFRSADAPHRHSTGKPAAAIWFAANVRQCHLALHRCGVGLCLSQLPSGRAASRTQKENAQHTLHANRKNMKRSQNDYSSTYFFFNFNPYNFKWWVSRKQA